MSTRLTWQNVAAPDFSTSAELLRGFALSLDKGLGAASKGLADWDQRKEDEISNILAARVASVQDPAKLEEMLATGALTADLPASRIGADDYRAISGDIDNLISRSMNRENLENTVFTNDYNQNTLAKQDAFAPYQAALARAAGDPVAREAIMKDPGFQKAYSDLRLADTVGTQKSILGLEGDIISNSQSRFNYNTDVEDREIQQQADALTAYATANSLGDPESTRMALIGSPAWAKADPRARVIALGKVNGALGFNILNDFAGGEAGTGAGIGNVGGTSGGIPSYKVMNYEAQRAGFKAVPDTVKTLGDARAFAKTVNRAGAGSSAMGLFQITGDTMEDFGKKVFKDKWQTTPWNVETQDKLGRAIFESSKGSAAALRGRWVSLSLAEAEQLRKQPWEVAREVIARKESGGTFDTLAANVETKTQVAEMGNEGASAGFNEYEGDKRSIGAIVKEATGKDGVFAGMNPNMLSRSIQNVFNSGIVNGVPKINYRQALHILENARTGEGLTPVGGLLGSLGINRVDPTKSSWNQAEIDKQVKMARRGGMSDTTYGQNVAVGKLQRVNQAQALVVEAQERIRAIQVRAASQGGRAPAQALEKAKAQLIAAQRELALAQQDYKNKPKPVREQTTRTNATQRRTPPKAKPRRSTPGSLWNEFWGTIRPG